MSRSIVIIDGHPDPDPARLCHALADAYAAGAEQAGHHVERIRLADLSVPVLRSQAAFESEPVSEEIAAIQSMLERADHWLIVYPLWLGSMPALLKALFEQVLRPGFAFGADTGTGGFPSGRLQGRSARVVVTMGMPALIYRWYFGAHSLKSLERHVLKFIGLGPVRENLFGMVDSVSTKKRAGWLATMRKLGRDGR